MCNGMSYIDLFMLDIQFLIGLLLRLLLHDSYVFWVFERRVLLVIHCLRTSNGSKLRVLMCYKIMKHLTLKM